MFTLLATAVASALLIAPTVHHRLAFREQEKEYIVGIANRLMLAGLGVLALAIVGAMVLVTDFLFAPGTTVAVGIGVFLIFALVWLAIPLRRRSQRLKTTE